MGRLLFRSRTAWIVAGAAAVAVAAFVVIYLTLFAPGPIIDSGGRVRARAVAKNFSLRDQYGRTFDLRAARGKPVVLAFLSTRSTGADQYIALKLRETVRNLEERVADVVFVAVSTDPNHDTQQLRLDYSRKVGMEDHWRFVSGDPAALKSLYPHYDVGISARAGDSGSADSSTTGTAATDLPADSSATDASYDSGSSGLAGALSEGLNSQARLVALLLDRVFGKAPAGTPYPVIWLLDKRGRFVEPLPEIGRAHV